MEQCYKRDETKLYTNQPSFYFIRLKCREQSIQTYFRPDEGDFG